MDGVVNEHVTAQNLYAKRGIKIRRRKKLPTKQLDIHIKNANQELEADYSKVSTVDSNRFVLPRTEDKQRCLSICLSIHQIICMSAFGVTKNYAK